MNRSRFATMLCLLLTLSLGAVTAFAGEPSAEALAAEREVLEQFRAWGAPVMFPGFFVEGYTFTDAAAVKGDTEDEAYYFLYENPAGESYTITFSFLPVDADPVQRLLTEKPTALDCGLDYLEDDPTESGRPQLIAARQSELEARASGASGENIVVYTVASQTLDIEMLLEVLQSFGNG